MPPKKEKDNSDTEEASERPSGSESDEQSDPEDHKGAVKKQQATASSSEESDVSDESSDEEPAQNKKVEPSNSKKGSNAKDSKDTNINLKKANEPSAESTKKSERKDEKKSVKIKDSPSTEKNAGNDSRAFGLRESFGTLREKRKSRKLKEGKEKSGILQKKGNINHKWERKFVKLSVKPATLWIYDLEPEQNEVRAKQTPNTVIHLDKAVVYARVQRRGAEMQSYFNIRFNKKDFLFKASSPEEKSEWVSAIKANKQNKQDDHDPSQQKGIGVQTPESQKEDDKAVEKASNIFLKLLGRESYLGVAKDS
eukprot:CAMPEP_0168560804 /NCGR_PEP_ID=MMETSP0413-20121227/11257_1 /TAXON_ID=136452 /ORGANISM="Filamoeba nolandi, Strain NC-AS-23-1" /LENGTH=309 /DNA_ID=CAMNT_0008592133 /DNA_START=72 /DNA_END=1001 /DNA_ORIENTATION=-